MDLCTKCFVFPQIERKKYTANVVKFQKINTFFILLPSAFHNKTTEVHVTVPLR